MLTLIISGSGEEFLMLSMYFCYFDIICVLSYEENRILLPRRCFLPSLIEIAPGEGKIFKCCQCMFAIFSR